MSVTLQYGACHREEAHHAMRDFTWPGRSGSLCSSEESWELHDDVEFIGWRLLERAQGSGLTSPMENLTRTSANASADPMYSKLFLFTCTFSVSRKKQPEVGGPRCPTTPYGQSVMFLGIVPAGMKLSSKYPLGYNCPIPSTCLRRSLTL